MELRNDDEKTERMTIAKIEIVLRLRLNIGMLLVVEKPNQFDRKVKVEPGIAARLLDAIG